MATDGKKKLKKKGSSSKRGEAKAISDDRFASAQSDPRFIDAPKRRSKVVIDSRFSRAFTDASFAPSNAPVDKRGKPRKNKDEANAASLSHYYSLQPQEDDKKALAQSYDENEDGDSLINREAEIESEKSDETSEEDEDDGQSFDESLSTSTTDSESDDQFIDEEEDDAFMPQEETVPEIVKETRRLAVVNLDWSQVRAVDLLVLLSSFLPKGGQIISVAVYPSEFGIMRMEEEAVNGPVGLFDDDEEEHDESEDDEMDNKKLRAYELSRLRYYYAAVECDSSATADCLYKICDGVEFERSANKLDLRFIPDSMEFKHQPRDVATEVPDNYEGTDFQTNALQQSNIRLTWDDDEPRRTKILRRKLNDKQLEELELKEFLASDESETDDEEDSNGMVDESVKKCSKRDKYRALVQSGDDGSDVDREENGDQDMEITFNSGLEDLSKRILEKKNKKSETVWEAYLRKRKEKKKKSKKGTKYSSDNSSDDSDDQELSEQPNDFFLQELAGTGNGDHTIRKTKKRKTDQEKGKEEKASQAELELLAIDDIGAETNLKGYNLKPKKIKGKKQKAVLGEGKIASADYDERFAAFFTSPLFALDPTDPQFKRSAAYARQITEKQKMGDEDIVKRQMDTSEIPGQDGNIASDTLSRRKEKNELSSLVRSIKMKSNQAALPPSRHKVSQKCKNSKIKQ